MTPIRNRSELEGRVVSLGTLSRSLWGAPILPFVLEVARPGRGSDRIPCCAMDEYAEELAGCLTVGVLLHVEGALRWNAKRRTLGVCIRPPRGSVPPHGAWWMPEEDGVPLDDAERAAEIARCRRESEKITAAMNGWEVPPENESASEMAERVRREMAALEERYVSGGAQAEAVDDKSRDAYDALRRLGEAQRTSVDTPQSGETHASYKSPEDETEDEAVKRIAQEIEDFIRMKEAYGNGKS